MRFFLILGMLFPISVFAGNWGTKDTAGAIKQLGSVPIDDDVFTGGILKFKQRQVKTPYAVQIVDKKDGFPVLTGSKSFRFEVRDYECNEKDCKDDRGRSEFRVYDPKGRKFEGEWWFRFSFFLNDEYTNIYPAKVVLGQVHTGLLPPFTFNGQSEIDGASDLYGMPVEVGSTSYIVQEAVPRDGKEKVIDVKGYYSGANTSAKTPILLGEEMLGRWVEVTIHANWTETKDGFFTAYIDKQKVYEFIGGTLPKGKQITFEFGIYRTFISRFGIYQAIENRDEKFLQCLDKAGIRKKVDSKSLEQIKHDAKFLAAINGTGCVDDAFKQRYPVPTQVVYYDDIVVSKEPLLTEEQLSRSGERLSKLESRLLQIREAEESKFRNLGFSIGDNSLLRAIPFNDLDLTQIKPFKIEEPTSSGTVKYRFKLKSVREPSIGLKPYRNTVSIFVLSNGEKRLSSDLTGIFTKSEGSQQEWERILDKCGNPYGFGERIEIPVVVKPGNNGLSNWFKCVVENNSHEQFGLVLRALLFAGQSLPTS